MLIQPKQNTIKHRKQTQPEHAATLTNQTQASIITNNQTQINHHTKQLAQTIKQPK